MTQFVDISAALDTRLNGMLSLPPVAWENRKYEPVNGTLYIRPTLLAGDVNTATLGSAGTDRNLGIYQVDVFAPSDKGKKEALEMADLIADRFKTDTEMTYNSELIRVMNVSRRNGINNKDGWYMMIVEIAYWSFTSRR